MDEKDDGVRMDGQITVFDFPNSHTLAPEMWECMKSCANCGKYMDWFPVREQGKRCVYGNHMDGVSGDDMILETGADSRVHIWCKYYKPKEKL